MASNSNATSTSIAKALYVCSMCRTKKKACDKQLPSCGYCTKRGLQCTYHAVIDRDLPDDHADRPFVLFFAKTQHARTAPKLGTDSTLNNGPQSLDAAMHSQVTLVFESLGVSFQYICEQYLRGFNQWLPVVCPGTFLKMQSIYIILPADWSVLLLTSCLLVKHPPLPLSKDHSPSSMESFYVFVKMLFTQTQAELSASIALAQAGTLLAAYDYACARPDAAYVSLNTCVGMMQTLGFDRPSNELDGIKQLGNREAWNVWWCIVVLQRYFIEQVFNEGGPVLKVVRLCLIELRRQAYCATAKFPDQNWPKPCDLSAGFSTLSAFNSATELAIPLTNNNNPGFFAQQARASRFVEEILEISNMKESDDIKLARMKSIGSSLQEYLGLIMGQRSTRSLNASTAVIPTILRSLFALHEDILVILGQSPTNSSQNHFVELHQDILSTYINMVADIACHSTTLKEPSPAPCCIYSVRTALRHAEYRNASVPTEATYSLVATFRALERSLTGLE